MSVALVRFRRDLRVADKAALAFARLARSGARRLSGLQTGRWAVSRRKVHEVIAP
jgi:deoxyribodipyrimidine photolyase